MSPLAHLLALPVRAYRLVASPWVGNACRFQAGGEKGHRTGTHQRAQQCDTQGHACLPQGVHGG